MKAHTKVQTEICLDHTMAGRMLDNISRSSGPFTPPLDMRQRVTNLETLPVLPDTARRLLELAADEDAGVHELAELVERDPALAAQMIRWARSPLYGYQGEINSVQDAVIRVLGFDLVLNVALGLAALESLNVPVDGPLGLRAYWRHAIYTSALVARLEKEISPELRPARGLAYLSGLLHNIGFLLLGHLFPKEFAYLNKLVATNPDMSVERLERFALGIDHCELGACLSESWGLPEAVTVVLAAHHNPYYQGDHDVLVKLVSVADSMLAGLDLGDVHDAGVAPDVLDSLGLDAVQLDEMFASLEEERADMDAFAQQVSG